jgi:hypothetical protein
MVAPVSFHGFFSVHRAMKASKETVIALIDHLFTQVTGTLDEVQDQIKVAHFASVMNPPLVYRSLRPSRGYGYETRTSTTYAMAP